MPQLQLSQGTIHYTDTGSGPVVVLVHGLLVDGTLWAEPASLLAKDFRVVVPDLPLGSHTEAMQPDADLSPAGLARLVADFLAALDLTGVTLVGNDTGGAVCQAVAARHPARLARLVLTPCDAFDNFLPFPVKHLQLFGRSAAGLKVLAESLRFRWIQRLPIAFGLLTRRPIPADIMASYTGPLRVNRGTRRDFARLVRAISVRYTQEAATGLTDFDRPVLLAWAQQNFFPVDHAERLAKLLPIVQLRVIDDSGPFVAEDQPRHLTQLIDQFLAQCASDSR